MNFVKHPLPWKAVRVYDDDWRVCDSNGKSFTDDLPSDLAHLIAVCPELYRSLKYFDDGEACWKKASAALAKANGESA